MLHTNIWIRNRNKCTHDTEIKMKFNIITYVYDNMYKLAYAMNAIVTKFANTFVKPSMMWSANPKLINF